MVYKHKIYAKDILTSNLVSDRMAKINEDFNSKEVSKNV